MTASSILAVTIQTPAALYEAYMPFIKRGGLFVPTKDSYALGDEIFVLLRLFSDTELLPFLGVVVWVTPPRAQASRTLGIGIQFLEKDGTLKSRIENQLAGLANSDQPTHCF
jgi:type IV pilus assembly protein PilZ